MNNTIFVKRDDHDVTSLDIVIIYGEKFVEKASSIHGNDFHDKRFLKFTKRLKEKFGDIVEDQFNHFNIAEEHLGKPTVDRGIVMNLQFKDSEDANDRRNLSGIKSLAENIFFRLKI